MIEEAAEDRPFWKMALAFWPLGFAVVATVGFAWFTWTLANEVTEQDGIESTRYEHFLSGRPNELGDTLAGFVGSLTLIWVVASVIQQSMELRAQRKEFMAMADAQGAQVRALDAQIAILQDEKRRMVEKEADEEFNELQSMFVKLVMDPRFLDLRYVMTKPGAEVGLDRCEFRVFEASSIVFAIKDAAAAMRKLFLSICLEMHSAVMARRMSGYSLEDNPFLRIHLEQTLQILREMAIISDRLSPAGRVRARAMDLTNSIRSLSDAIEAFRSGTFGMPRVTQ
ncbi:hypothetical protein LHP98_15385 [Rhodobacter sp. Har01]|uniref:hypothetical protein n=1 Tax=Rhodobacter sp. Har01 TaxID=2883999 RepID=UPI001D07B39D|nr:hypothetical protein [Rhodobacter sp. Har01]MCB6179505.1 hypothetical protein [Rhodobacter sp. Har01]